jgi:hypothetical protein
LKKGSFLPPDRLPMVAAADGSLVADDWKESIQSRLLVRERVKLGKELDRWDHEIKMTYVPF